MNSNRILVKEVRMYFYSDGSLEYRTVALPSRDPAGHFLPRTPRKPRTPHVTPDPMISCPACGAVFRIGKKLA